MARFTWLVVLCEDRQQEVFARRFLERCGVIPGRIHYRTCPKGKQAGEQYVRERYVLEVESYRRHCHSKNIGVAVITDADTRSVADRCRQIEDALIQAGFDGRKPHERIGIFVPKRNIETWIHYLKGNPVNEDDDYPKMDGSEAECRSGVQALADRRREPLPNDAPPSLRIACDELHRIL